MLLESRLFGDKLPFLGPNQVPGKVFREGPGHRGRSGRDGLVGPKKSLDVRVSCEHYVRITSPPSAPKSADFLQTLAQKEQILTRKPHSLYHLFHNDYIAAPYLRTINFGRRNVIIKSQKSSWNYFWAP